MSTKPPSDNELSPFAAVIREIAAEQSNPLERKSLLETAAKVEAADAKFYQTLSSAQDDMLRIRAEIDLIQRRNDLPGWVVAVVLLAFALFLVYVALKHHV